MLVTNLAGVCQSGGVKVTKDNDNSGENRGGKHEANKYMLALWTHNVKAFSCEPRAGKAQRRPA